MCKIKLPSSAIVLALVAGLAVSMPAAAGCADELRQSQPGKPQNWYNDKCRGAAERVRKETGGKVLRAFVPQSGNRIRVKYLKDGQVRFQDVSVN